MRYPTPDDLLRQKSKAKNSKPKHNMPRVDAEELTTLAEVLDEALDLATACLSEIKAKCEHDPAYSPYWKVFYNQIPEGEEILPHQIKAFVSWLINKQRGALQQKKHLRLVVSNTSNLIFTDQDDPDPSSGGECKSKRPRLPRSA